MGDSSTCHIYIFHFSQSCVGRPRWRIRAANQRQGVRPNGSKRGQLAPEKSPQSRQRARRVRISSRASAAPGEAGQLRRGGRGPVYCQPQREHRQLAESPARSSRQSIGLVIGPTP